jgi:nucleotide-binding universal stress UspA family protein
VATRTLTREGVEIGLEPFDRIAVGFDGSAYAERACRVAVALAGKFHSRLTVLAWVPGANDSTSTVLQDLVPVTADGVGRAKLMEELRASALGGGAQSFEAITIHDDVLDSMLGWLERNSQDLMVVASRGQSRSRRLVMGSLSTGLVAGSPCPVLVVRGRKALRPSGVPKGI